MPTEPGHKEYRVILARQEVTRLTKARDHVSGKAGQYDLVNYQTRLNEFASEGWVVKFSNATNVGETGRLIVYAVLERLVEAKGD